MTRPIVYLNNAATTWPKPPAVLNIASEVFSLPFHEHGRTTIKDAPDYIGMARESIATFLGVTNPGNIVFTPGATGSLNLLIHGFAAHSRRPFHVVTTDLEHNSVLRPLRALERDGRCSVSIIRTNGPYIEPDQVQEAMQDNTSLVVVGHGSNVLGSVQDLGTIGKVVKDEGAFFLVDGAQTAGQYPVSLGRLPVDAFVFTGHKSLFGLPGTGGFYLKDPTLIDPVQQGGTGFDSKALYQPEIMPEKFEAGTPNYPGIAALGAGVRFVSKTGVDSIHAESRKLSSYLVRAIGRINGITLYNPDPDLPVITFAIDGIDTEEIGFILWKAYGIVVRTGLHCSPLVHERINPGGGVRISLSCMNTMADCEAAVAAIEEITGT